MIQLFTWECEHIEPCYNICTAMDVHCRYVIVCYNYYKCKKLNSLKHLVRTTVAGSHN